MSGETSRFAIGATLTHASASSALAAGLARIEAGATAVDCAQLTQFDSSALAVLLAWRRAAQARGNALAVLNVPAGLASLAQVYGIDALFTAQRTAAPAPASAK
ncbi:STAS domain-containing protein [Trinickia sp.]|uniref:STAS domain-containing protein n=1 Tax=Trinickia sp. TaxID=2571163 RepID=UPI003F7D9709